MSKNEQAFLAQVALGWFSIHEDGSIWRSIEFEGGPTPTMKWIPSRPADVSESKDEGYVRVMFHHKGERLQVAAHRIIWMTHNRAMIPDIMEVNHKDGKKDNNEPSNLELMTRPENVKHAIHVLGCKRRKAQPGMDNAMAKLTESQVMEIRALGEAKAMSQREIGERFGLTQSGVSAILRRKSWAHLIG